MSEALDAFTAAVGDAIGQRAHATFVSELRRTLISPPPDPLLTVSEIAARIGLSKPIVYRLIEQGYMKAAEGLDVKRVRQSIVDAYGTANPVKTKK